jgi:uncharacterized protein YbbK (DUF523 family)/uncharacterized protein YbgA (DUF1722 family)
VKVRLGISACLLGETVRWDGGHKRDAFLAETLAPHVEWVPVCPEVELGLGVPREPIRLEGDSARPRLVAIASRTDHTRAMRRLARARAAALARLSLAGYVLKSDSPSCGMARVRVHGSAGRSAPRGVGLFARALMERLPLLPVEDEARLADPAARESFIERVFAHARWQDALARGMTRRRLVAFHERQELLVRAHDPAAWRRLGALVKRARPLRALTAAYGSAFTRALRTPATPGRHAAVLREVVRRLGDRPAPGERAALVSAVAGLRRGRVPVAVPITLAGHHARRLGIGPLARQSYLAPHPAALLLRSLLPPRSPTAPPAGSRSAPPRRRSSP